MTEKFQVFYQDGDQWVLVKEVDDTLINVLQELYHYPSDKKYRLEKITITGSQVINFE
jgi:hypothetical protein